MSMMQQPIAPPQSLKGWLKATVLPLPTDSADKFKKLVISGNLGEELNKSYQYVTALQKMQPAGITVATREFADVKKLVSDNAEGVMFSGTLSQLRVDERALSTIDYGRIGYIIESAENDAQLKNMLGVIIVNIEDGEQLHFMRANKDAEVDALCLLMYWNSQNQEVQSRLIALASDLVFHGRRLGAGSKVFAAKFELMNADEKSREAMAVSAWRKCIFLSEYVDRILLEDRFPDAKIPSERLLKAMTEDCTKIDGWNVDTLGRYLLVGRRLSEHVVRNWLIVWEATCKRNAFLDGIMFLRACVAATPADDELANLLQILFLEQRCGLKKTLKVDAKQSPSNLFKAYLLRMKIFTHLEFILPKLADVVHLYGSAAFFATEYSLDAQGSFTSDCQKPVHDEEEQEEVVSDDNAECEGTVTTYKSRRLLIAFCHGLAKHKFERSFLSMAKEGRSTGHILDLTSPASGVIAKQIKEIQQTYADDFREAAFTPEKTKEGLMPNNLLEVQVESTMLDEESYKNNLAQWNEDVAAYVDNTLDSFVQSHLVLVVDDQKDTEKMIRKIHSLPLLKENKRKLFIHDENVEPSVPWDRIQRRKMSVFARMHHMMIAEDLDPIVELYSAAKTKGDDGLSEDMLMVMLPGPPPNIPISKNLDVVHKKLKSITPKLQLPKIGKIEIERCDVLTRAKQHAAFTGVNENHIVFSTEKKGCMHKAPMAHLKGGDIFFNRWPVPSIRWSQLMKLPKATADKMFVERENRPVLADDASDGEYELATSDEIALDKDFVIPYPHEHNMQLGLELIHVFAADVVVTTTMGSGELFKAVLQKHKFGVGICKTASQKKQVMITLKGFAKLMNLVSLKDGPVKSAELLKYEKDLQKKANPKPADPAIPKPADPAIPKPAHPAIPTPATLPIAANPPVLAGFGASVL